MKKLLFLFLFFIPFVLKAQVAEDSCGTAPIDSVVAVHLPWYGDNDFLEQFYDSLVDVAAQNCNNCRIGSPGRFEVPVRLYNWRRWQQDGATGAIHDYILHALLNRINQRLDENNVPIFLYPQCDIAYPKRTNWYERLTMDETPFLF